MPAYTGFGSGPYDTLKYDRSWVTAFVTLGVSASEAYALNKNSSDRVTLGIDLKDVEAADSTFHTNFSLGVGAFTSVGGGAS